MLWVHQSQGCLIFAVLFSNSFLTDSSRCDRGCHPGILEIKVKLAEGNQVEICLPLLSTVCTIHTTEIIHNVLFGYSHWPIVWRWLFYVLPSLSQDKGQNERHRQSQILKKKAIHFFNVLNFEPSLSCCHVYLENTFFFFDPRIDSTVSRY